jgi:hypothetical protein
MHFKDLSGVLETNYSKLRNSHCNTLRYRFVSDNTQICLEHTVIKAPFADGGRALDRNGAELRSRVRSATE